MKFWEVLPLAVEQGEKIRQDTWIWDGDRRGLEVRDGALVWASSGREARIHSTNIMGDNWEVVEENPHEKGTGPWAAWWLERDRRVTRDCWGGLSAVARADGSIRVLDGRNIVTSYDLCIADLAATDWRLADEG